MAAENKEEDDAAYERIVMAYIREHMRKICPHLPKILEKATAMAASDYNVNVHVLCRVDTDLMFAFLFPEVRYITMVFAASNRFPGTVFMTVSDHKDGVYNRLAKESGCYTMGAQNIWHKNGNKEVPVDEFLKFHAELPVKYAEVDWETGKIIGAVKALPA